MHLMETIRVCLAEIPEIKLDREIFTDTKDPILSNFNPDANEMRIRMACHILCDAADTIITLKEEDKVFLCVDIRDGSYEPEDGEEPKPKGTVEYQVSDGLPGKRSTCHSFDRFDEAIEHFDEVVKAGGFVHWFGQADAEAT